ncbi:MAG: molybdopterin-dependent oxidoreductase, partial [Armatimonadota bacterium]|nr:molybdopterin-dependent oxidoreductase [Armatimonadota bacterium]
GMVNAPERLREPLVRRNGVLEPASWEEALDVAASRLSEIAGQHGGGAIGGIGSPRLTNEEAYLFGKLMRAVLRTNHLDYRTNSKRPFSAASLARLLSLAPPEGSLVGLRRAALVLLVGSDITSENPWSEKQIIQSVSRNGGEVILAYPRRVRQVEYASRWLRYAPGGEAALVRALADAAAGQTGAAFPNGAAEVPPEEIVACVDRLRSTPNAVVVVGPGVTCGADPDEAMNAVADLVEALRSTGRTGVHVVVQALANNTRGAQDMGLLPDTYPGYTGMAVEHFAKAWGESLPAMPGLHTPGMLAAAARGDVKALYVVGANPMVTFPDGLRVREALAKVEFLVVQDLFLTATAREADVVFPAASFAEKDGTFTNMEGRVQRVRRALEPVGACRADWEVFVEMARRLGAGWSYLSPREVALELASTVPLYGVVNDAALEGALSPIRVPNPAMPTGGGRASAQPLSSRQEANQEAFPFVLMTGQWLFHCGTLSTWAPEMRLLSGQAYVEVAPEDAARLEIAHGERVRLVSARGEIMVMAHLQPGGTPGILFLANHFADPPVNLLLDGEVAVDRVRIEKV